MMRHVIWITGMPRSGTNWLAQIFASCPAVRLKLCPLFSYEFKNALDSTSTGKQWRVFFEQVYDTPGRYLDQDYLRQAGAVPEFMDKDPEPENLVIKSTRFHDLTPSILEKHQSIRFVGIVRHPCATIHSWLTNPLEYPKTENPDDQWRTGECRKNGPGEFWGFDDWKLVANQHMALAEKYPERFFLIRYEDFVKNALHSTIDLFTKLNLPFTEQTKRFVKDSQNVHNEHKRAVFKSPSVKDRWRKEMDPIIMDSILAEIEGTSLARFSEE